MMTFAFSAAALLALAGVDPTGDTVARPSPKPQTQQDAQEVAMQQRFCTFDTTPTSRIRRKFCQTRGEWIAETGVDPAGEPRK